MRRHAGLLVLLTTLSLGSLAACGDDGGGGGSGGESTETTETTSATGTTVAGDGATDTTANGETADTTAGGGDGSEGTGAADSASNPLVIEFCEQVAAYLDAAAAYSEDPEGTDLATVETLFEDLNATLTEVNAITEDLTPADGAAVRECAEELVAAPRP